MTRRTEIFACAALLVILVGWGLLPAGARRMLYNQVSCHAMAEEISGLSLGERPTKISCSNNVIMPIDITYKLEDSALKRAALQASHDPRFRRTEQISDSLTSSIWRGLRELHGWYYTTLGQHENHGYTLVVLDETAATLHAYFATN